MKAKGPKIERETVIILNDADDMADVWTASNQTYKRLLKLGYQLTEDNERSASFKIPKACVSLRRPKATSEKRIKALERARSKARGRSNENGLSVQ
jgi:hypothetical protein